MIYSLGYQHLSADDIDAVLEIIGADLLVDVRSVPSSRKRGFSRAALSERLGDRYAWRGDSLGGKGRGPTEEGLRWLAEAAEGRTIALMCLEEAPGDCHRHGSIALPLLERGIDVRHVYLDVVVSASELDRSIQEQSDYAFELLDPSAFSCASP